MIMKSLTKLLPCNLAQGLAGVSNQAIIKQVKLMKMALLHSRNLSPGQSISTFLVTQVLNRKILERSRAQHFSPKSLISVFESQF